MDLGYVREKFRIAVLTLVESNEPLRQRLADAWTTALCRLQIEDLPPADRDDFSAMLSKIASTETLTGKAVIAVGTSALTRQEATIMEATIISIYANICRLHPQS